VNGVLYGVTYAGGVNDHRRGGWGTIFSFDPAAGTENVVHRFHASGSGSGALPYQTLLYTNKMLYGAAECAHSCPEGLDFRLDPSSGEYMATAKFAISRYSGAGGMVASHGSIWGTDLGGIHQTGSIFQLDREGHRTALYSFAPRGDDEIPDIPVSAPLPMGNGFYGTTRRGGRRNGGALYVFDPGTGGGFAEEYAFYPGSDGYSPSGDLARVDTTLYVTMERCVAECSGTVFSYDLATLDHFVLYRFTGGLDGGFPANGVTVLKGKLYGTTKYGGRNNAGVIFEIDPKSGQERVLHSFASDGGPSGSVLPQGLIAVNDTLYGVTYGGGKNSKFGGKGVIFSYSP